MQETMLRAWNAARRGLEPERPEAWLAHVGRREALRIYHGNRRFAPYEPERDDTRSIASAADASPQRLDVVRAVGGLPEADRALVYLRYWHDLDYAEIGQRTNMAESAVRVRLHRVRARLARDQFADRAAPPPVTPPPATFAEPTTAPAVTCDAGVPFDRAYRPPDARTLKALAHPLRFHILTRLSDREASASELAREMDAKVDVVSYHIRTLRDLGAIRLVRTEQRRSSVERFYTAAVRAWLTDEEYTALPVGVRRSLAAPLLKKLVDKAVSSLSSGGFDAPQATVAWVDVNLDAEGHAEAHGLIEELLARLGEVEKRAAARAAKRSGPDERAPYQAGALYFAVTPDA